MKKLYLLVWMILPFCLMKLHGQENFPDAVGTYLTECIRRQTSIRDIKIDSISFEKKRLQLFANEYLSYGRFDQALTDAIYSKIRSLLPDSFNNIKRIELYSDGYKIEDYIPLNRKERYAVPTNFPLKKETSRPYKISKGLQNRHIALWHSHGWYYNGNKNRWEWQRARLFQTVEDLFPQSFVLPYLIPMLEKAGANVLVPRERDMQCREVIVDNDRSSLQSSYTEVSGVESWAAGENPGFAHLKVTYADLENPFRDGTYRQVKTISGGKESFCTWLPDIPEKGRYGVYISYASLNNSAKDARYTVYHTGGKTEFTVNQTMGGGTWIFLGFFDFDRGCNDRCKIVLSNQSRDKGRIVTADAVKIGGGMGNIARGKPLEPSGRSRYAEGSRYWLQWAGMPDSIYRYTKGKSDYTDDYQSRGLWVNHLINSHVPVDAVLAFHTDAGTTHNDSVIGTLGICMTHYHDEKFADGTPRILSRDLVSTVMDEIVNDIRTQYEPEWTRRHIRNRSYSEARLPEAPTMLLELLSHQNFADMRYGLDPNFRFTVSRAIYKGFLKFIAYRYRQKYVVTPLPVKSFGARFTGETRVHLEWQAVNDPSEPTALPSKYRIYTAVGENDFDNGRIVTNAQADITIEKDKMYRFRIAAVNEGGEGFPSEILSVCRKANEKGVVLIVNGFTRISAPDSFSSRDSIAGFLDFLDHGVPDGIQTDYIGSQYEFRRKIPWTDNDAAGFGAGNADYETTQVAGNTFNYPFVHGKSIAAAGYSFVSTSSEAVMNGKITMNDYKTVDMILGKQKQTQIGRGVFPPRFKTFPDALQTRITDYCRQGGNIFVSGAYAGSDLWDNPWVKEQDKRFAQDVLKYKRRTGHAAVTGRVKSVSSPFPQLKGAYRFYNRINPDFYAVESPDAIEPSGENSHTVFRYGENLLSAGVAYSGSYKTCVLGFPFETIRDESGRNQLMRNLLDFMCDKTSPVFLSPAALVDSVRLWYVPDRRDNVYEITVGEENGNLLVKGFTSVPEAQRELMKEIRKENPEAVDNIILLPDKSPGDKLYGIVNVSVADLRMESNYGAEMGTQLLLGMPLQVLQHDGWYRVKTPEGYVAWMEKGVFVQMNKETFNQWTNARKIIFTDDYGFAYETPDEHKLRVSDLVFGNLLKYEGDSGSFYRVSYPDGRQAYVLKTQSRMYGDWLSSVSLTEESIIREAILLKGIPYVWGGTSVKGMDCSGFSKTVFLKHGVILRRDASQQAKTGIPVDINRGYDSLRSGDLLFFGTKTGEGEKEYIRHVAIYIGNREFIHASGFVRISSLDSSKPHYDRDNAEELIRAARVIGAVGTEGIWSIGNHKFFLTQE